MTPATLVIARVDPAHGAAKAGVCFLPFRATCVPRQSCAGRTGPPFPQKRARAPGMRMPALRGRQTSSTHHMREDAGQSGPGLQTCPDEALLGGLPSFTNA